MSVKLIARTTGVGGESVEDLLSHAFSQCYQKQANIGVVIRNLGHQSVLEHISFTFDIQVSRVTWDQLVRHRIASYTAQSHRYTDISEEDFYFYIPEEISKDDLDEWINDAKTEYKIYKKWRDRGVKKQSARYLAPIGVSIKATITFNLRSLLNMLALRSAPHAQEEIKHFAKEVWEEVKPLFPNLEPKLEEVIHG